MPGTDSDSDITWGDLVDKFNFSQALVDLCRDHDVAPALALQVCTYVRTPHDPPNHPSAWLQRMSAANDDLWVHEEQCEAAFIILCCFLMGKRWITLFSQMQTGKTGVVQQVTYWVNVLGRPRHTVTDGRPATAISREQLNVAPDNIWICLQKPDNSVLNQNTNAIADNIWVPRNNKNQHPHIFHTGRIRSVKKTLRDYRRPAHTHPGINSLVILDESHWGARQNGAIRKFLNDMLDCDPSNPDTLSENNIYIVSVSATPMAELHDLDLLSDLRRLVIPRVPGTYLSVQMMLEQGRVLPDCRYFRRAPPAVSSGSDSEGGGLEEGEQQRFNEFWDIEVPRIRAAKGSDCFYIIARFPPTGSGTARKFAFSAICEERGAEVCEYNADDRDDFSMAELDGPPRAIKVVFVKNYLRLGQKVNTAYVGAMIEVSSQKSQQVDTIVQGLVGRACGHHKLHDNVRIYCDVASVQSYRDLVAQQGRGFKANALGIANGEPVATTRGVVMSMFIRQGSVSE